MGNGHAFLSPSKHAQWAVCAGGRALEELEGVPSRPSRYAAYGTKAHAVAAELLENPDTAVQFQDEEMAVGVRRYLQHVQQRIKFHEDLGAKVTIEIEKSLLVESITTEVGAKGTADVVLLALYPNTSHIEIIDLKFGMEHVEAVENGQLMVYASAAVAYYSQFHFSTATLIISQPRVDLEPRIWNISAERLEQFAISTRAAGSLAIALRGCPESAKRYLRAGSKQCRWCSYKSKCDAYRKFEDLNKLDGFDDVL